MTDEARSLLAAYDEQVRRAEREHLPPGAHAEADGPIVRVVGLHRGFVSAPVDLGIAGAELDELIRRQRDFFAARGEAVEWKTRGHDRPANTPERLVAAGFVPEPAETVLIGLTEVMAAQAAPLPEGVVIRQTVDEADLRRIGTLESRVWDDDESWMADELVSRVRADPQQLVVFVADAAGEVVSAGWITFEPGTEFAALWGGSTLAAWRRRGIYRALVARRARLAAERGTRYLEVDASDDSRPILQRLGFVPVTTTTPYVWTPATSGR